MLLVQNDQLTRPKYCILIWHFPLNNQQVLTMVLHKSTILNTGKYPIISYANSFKVHMGPMAQVVTIGKQVLVPLEILWTRLQGPWVHSGGRTRMSKVHSSNLLLNTGVHHPPPLCCNNLIITKPFHITIVHILCVSDLLYIIQFFNVPRPTFSNFFPLIVNVSIINRTRWRFLPGNVFNFFHFLNKSSFLFIERFNTELK